MGKSRRLPAISQAAFLEDGRDDRFRKFIYSFLVTSVRMGKIREKIGSFIGLNGTQYHILTVISENAASGPISVGHIAETLRAGKTLVTMEIGNLVKMGLVEKLPNPDDKRSVLVSLTDKGSKTIEHLAPYRSEINDALFEGFSSNEFHAFESLLAKMVGTTETALATADALAAATKINDAA